MRGSSPNRIHAAAALGAAWGTDLTGWIDAGLKAWATGQGATVFALLSWHGFFMGIVALMALYAVLRLLIGHVEARRPWTFQLLSLFFTYSAGQGAFSAALTALSRSRHEDLRLDDRRPDCLGRPFHRRLSDFERRRRRGDSR